MAYKKFLDRNNDIPASVYTTIKQDKIGSEIRQGGFTATPKNLGKKPIEDTEVAALKRDLEDLTAEVTALTDSKVLYTATWNVPVGTYTWDGAQWLDSNEDPYDLEDAHFVPDSYDSNRIGIVTAESAQYDGDYTLGIPYYIGDDLTNIPLKIQFGGKFSVTEGAGGLTSNVITSYPVATCNAAILRVNMFIDGEAGSTPIEKTITESAISTWDATYQSYDDACFPGYESNYFLWGLWQNLELNSGGTFTVEEPITVTITTALFIVGVNNRLESQTLTGNVSIDGSNGTYDLDLVDLGNLTLSSSTSAVLSSEEINLNVDTGIHYLTIATNENTNSVVSIGAEVIDLGGTGNSKVVSFPYQMAGTSSTLTDGVTGQIQIPALDLRSDTYGAYPVGAVVTSFNNDGIYVFNVLAYNDVDNYFPVEVYDLNGNLVLDTLVWYAYIIIYNND